MKTGELGLKSVRIPVSYLQCHERNIPCVQDFVLCSIVKDHPKHKQLHTSQANHH